MPTDGNRAETTLPPDDAFAVLGNENRMEILQTLGEATDPLSFSELRDRVGVRDSGQFNYHLDKLEGHFVTKMGDGEYALRQAGKRVIEAVLSGAVTEAPIVERTAIDMDCPYCGAPTEMRYLEERAEGYCTECAGTFGSASTLSAAESLDKGFLGTLFLPPAGIEGRTPLEIMETGATWANLRVMAAASGICPRCSAPLETDVAVCERHDVSEGLCEQCNNHHQVRFESQCTNCIFSTSGVFALRLTTNPDFLHFQIDHDLNPVTPDRVADWIRLLLDYDEEIVSTEPFEARFTFTLDDESLTLHVDDDLRVTEASKDPKSHATG